MERQDRWGTGHALSGPDPSLFTTPWIGYKLAVGWPVSHGPSLGENGIGYFGDWVDNKLYKFNYNTGATLGSFSTLDFVASVPAIGSGNRVFVSTDSPGARFFNVDSSIMDFNWFRVTGYVGGSPILGPDESVVISTSSGSAYRIHPVSGLDIWSRTGLGTPRGCCFTRDDSKVIVSNGNNVTALNFSDGTIAWTAPVGSIAAAPSAAPNGTIVVGTEGGFVYGLSPTNGAVLWTKQALAEIRSAPAFSPDGTVAYINSYDWRLYAFRVSDGLKLWSFTTTHWNEKSPTVGFDGRIYVHNKFGDLYCVAPNGTQIWTVHLNGEARGPMTIAPDGTLFVGYTGNNGSGLAAIRQQALSLTTDSIAVERGTLLSGTLNDVLASDDSYYKVNQAFDGDRSERPLRVVCTTATPYLPLSKLKLTLEAKINASGINQYVELYNFNSNSWVQIDLREASQTDSTLVLEVPNAAQYASNNGVIKVRLSYKPSSSAPGNRLLASFDFVHVDVVPQFVP